MKLYEAYKNQKKKMEKIAKMQKEAYDLTKEVESGRESFNTIAENTMERLIGRKIHTGIQVDKGYGGSRELVIYQNGLGEVYHYNSGDESRASHLHKSYLFKAFKENGDKIVEALRKEGIPEEKIEIYKKIAKTAKNLWDSGNYERPLKKSVITNIYATEQTEKSAVLKITSDKEDRYVAGKLQVVTGEERHDITIKDDADRDNLYRYLIVEQVYGDCVKILRKAINDKKKRVKHNTKELEKMKDGVAGYLALREL